MFKSADNLTVNNTDLADLFDAGTAGYFIVNAVRGRDETEYDVMQASVRGRAGTLITGKQLRERPIEVDFTLKGESADELRERLRSLTELLSVEKLTLEFDDDLGLTYQATLQNVARRTEVNNIYQGTAVFICADPYKHGTSKTLPFADGAATVHNNGMIEAEPVITVNVANASTFLSIGDGTDKFNQIGRQIDVSEETPYTKYTKVFDKLGNNLTGWTAADEIDKGTVQGSFLTDGQAFRANSYGATTSLWRGPALKQSLPQLTQDFRVDAFITVEQEAMNQVGRAEVYLLNAAGQRIGKLSMKNTGGLNGSNIGEVNIREGAGVNGEFIIQTAGIRPKLWNDFYGVLRIERIGNKFSAYIAKIDDGVYNTAWSATYTDYDGHYLEPLAAIEIHVGAYGSNTFITDMAIHRVIVYQVNNPNANEVPNIVEAGDEVVFDHVKKNILINGESRIDLKDFAGRYFRLAKGKNTLYMLPSDIGTAKIEIKERYL